MQIEYDIPTILAYYGASADSASFSVGTSMNRFAFTYDYYVPVVYWEK